MKNIFKHFLKYATRPATSGGIGCPCNSLNRLNNDIKKIERRIEKLEHKIVGSTNVDA